MKGKPNQKKRNKFREYKGESWTLHWRKKKKKRCAREVVKNTCTGLSDPTETATDRRRCQVYEPLESTRKKRGEEEEASKTAAGAASPRPCGDGRSRGEEGSDGQRRRREFLADFRLAGYYLRQLETNLDRRRQHGITGIFRPRVPQSHWEEKQRRLDKMWPMARQTSSAFFLSQLRVRRFQSPDENHPDFFSRLIMETERVTLLP